MKTRQYVIAGLLVLLVAGSVFLLWFRPNPTENHPLQSLEVAIHASGPTSREPVSALFPKTNEIPHHNRLEVQSLYNFANVVRLYNFNPEIIVCQTNEKLRMMEVATPTHSAEIVRGFPMHLSSHYDSSDTRGDSSVINTWYKCTGTWSEKEAVVETLAILQRLGKAEVAERLAKGPHEYLADPIRVLTPDGRRVEVTPFPTVGFKNSNIVLKVEFRMGSNGPAGLTRWFYLGP